MKTLRPSTFAAVLALICVTTLGSSCGGPKPKSLNLSFSAKTQASVEVDIVGASELELPDWRSYSMTKYFQPGDAMRRGADKVTVRIVGGRAEPGTINLQDEVWNRWFSRGARYLVILAHLPGDYQDGPADPRRKVIDLTKAFKNDVVETQIQDSRIVILTPQKQ